MVRNLMKNILALVMVTSLSLAARAQGNDNAGVLSQESFTNDAGTRSYTVFAPQNLNANSGLLVVLHGCFMTGQQMISGTLLNQHAAKAGFAVIYPEQTYQDNSWKCWNWFKPENQQRQTGESSIIIGMVKDTIQKYKLNPRKVYVTGLSAGSAMAANLLGCYADVFAGGLLNSGLEFAAAQTESDAHKVTADGPSRDTKDVAREAYNCSPRGKALLKVIVVHGTKDPYVNPVNADRTFEVFSKLNAMIFMANGGLQTQMKMVRTPISRPEGQYSGQLAEALFNGKSVVKEIMMDEMGHGWSGGQSSTLYMEPKGIDASQLIVDEFFP